MSTTEQVPLPDEYASSEGLPDQVSLLRTQVLQRMLGDFQTIGLEPSTADLLILERISYTYAHIRSREMSTMAGNHGFANDRTYRDMLALLFGAVEQVQKRLSTAMVEAEVRRQVMEVAVRAVEKAISGISDPEIRSQVMHDLASELGRG